MPNEDKLPVEATSGLNDQLGRTKVCSKFIVQRRFQCGLPWKDHAYPKNDFESAKSCLDQCREWEAKHSKFPGKLRLIRITTEVFAV